MLKNLLTTYVFESILFIHIKNFLQNYELYVQCICTETKKGTKKEKTHIKHPQVTSLWAVQRKIH